MSRSYLNEEEGGEPSGQRGQHVQRSCSRQGGSVLVVGRGRESWGQRGEMGQERWAGSDPVGHVKDFGPWEAGEAV